MKKGPITPKGFRDIMPGRAQKRRAAINTICDTYEAFGFLPLETPTLEFAKTLLGKYGEEEKLIYQFVDRGGRKLALRYDLTVPLARFVANNIGLLNPTFSRYQLGQCFRGENTQKGRYREFTQLDLDIVGSKNKPEEDAKIIAAAITAAKKLGLNKAVMAINDRENFAGVNIEVVRAIDKIYKIGKEAAKKQILDKELGKNAALEIDEIETKKPTQNLIKIFQILKDKYHLKISQDFFFDPTLARGLDYYTGCIFELKPNGKRGEMSIGGGGRYNHLVGMFLGRDIPAVGFSFGIDRLVEALP
jgi:histidyl-tRNA synthetase